MTPDWFTGVNFDESSYDEYFQRVHDPEKGYEYIRYLNDNLDDGIEIHGYAQVDLFRATMQYTEEFLIYFLSYINTEDNFVEDLIRNRVRVFCKHYTNNTVNEYFNDASFQFDNRLKAVFGYDDILAADDPTNRFEDDLSADEIENRVTESVENIYSQLTTICRYYRDFIDMYNATKHGNRFQISPSPTLRIDNDQIYHADQSFATFLCKQSGDTSEGRPYLSTYPLDRLVDRSLTIADRTNTLFTYMNAVVEDRLDENTYQTKRFFLHQDPEEIAEPATPDDTDIDGSDTGETIEIWNQDAKTVLPRTEELADLVTDPVSEVAVRLSIDNDTIRVKTHGDSEISDEYPIIGTITYQPRPGPRLKIGYSAKFSINLYEIDMRQCHELIKYEQRANNGELTQLAIEFEDIGVEAIQPIDGLEPPVIPDTLYDEELIKNLALAQKITQTRLPLPPIFLNDQADMINDVVENHPERDDVIDAIDKAQAIGEDVEYTQILAEAADEDRQLQELYLFPGSLKMTFEQEGSDDPENLREYLEDSDTNTGESLLNISDRPGTYEQFLEEVSTLGIIPLVIYRQPGDGSDPEDTFSAKVDIKHKSQTFWYDLHQIIIRRTD